MSLTEWIERLMGTPEMPTSSPVEIDPELYEMNQQLQTVRGEVVELSKRVSIAEKQLRSRGFLQNGQR